MNVKIIVLIILSLISIIIISLFIRRAISGGHITPPGSDKSWRCPASNVVEELKACDPKNMNSCKDCNSGPRICTTVSDETPYKVAIDGSVVNIPNGNWCLPVKPKTLPCNPYSGYPILAKLSEKEYAWKCQCKYPKLFINKGVFGDCTQEVACGALANPDNHLVCPNDAKECTPGESWLDNPTWNPTAGVCSCSNGTKFVDQSQPEKGVWDKECVVDTCSPGQAMGNDCECPQLQKTDNGYTSYLRCPTDLPPGGKIFCQSGPTCIRDPCNPGGYFDTNTGNCRCDIPGYVTREDSQSVIKHICDSPCNEKENPCGNRGDCIINGDGKAECTNCKKPWMNDKTKMCKDSRKKSYETCQNNDDCLSNLCRYNWPWSTEKSCV